MLNKKFIQILFRVLFVSGGFFFVAHSHHAFAETGGMQGHHYDAGYTSVNKEVTVNLETVPASLAAESPAAILLSFKGPEGKSAELTPTHDRILHVIIASRDFSVFAHIHPEDFGLITAQMKETARFPVRFTFPKAGRYLIGVDSAIKEKPFSVHFLVDVAGKPEMGHLTKDFSREKRMGDYYVVLSSTPEVISAGKEVTLDYFFKKDGKPVTDLEPYISAPMHVSIISTDLKYFIHTHGEVPGTSPTIRNEQHMHMTVPSKFGPKIEVHTVFPAKGVYEIFGEAEHQGKVIVTRFMVQVE